MGRSSNSGKRRDQIVRAMAQVIARSGYEGASVGEIARAAGLTTGLLHYHFESKQEILLELVATLGKEHLERVEARLENASTSGARLDAFIDVHLALGYDAEPVLVACWVAVAAEAVRTPVIRMAYQRFVEDDLRILESLVRACLKDAGESTQGAKAISAAVFAAIQGCFVLAVAAPETIPAGSAAGTVRRMAAGLLRAQGK